MFFGLKDNSGLINCVPGLGPHLSAALVPGLPWAPVTSPYPAILAPAADAVRPPAAASDPGLPGFVALAAVFAPVLAALAPAAGAVRPPAAASDPGLPGLAAGQGPGPGPVSECFRYPGAAAACVRRLERPAGAELNAGFPAALDFLSAALHLFPAGQGRALYLL